MNRDRKYFAIGLFVLLGFLLLAAGCILFGGSGLFTRKVYFETYFATSVQGMDVGSPVKLRGVRVGTVEEIGFTRSLYAGQLPETAPVEDLRALSYVRVLCSLDAEHHGEFRPESLERLVERGLIAKLGSQGITGIVFVDLDFLAPRDRRSAEFLRVPWLPEERYIPSVPNTLQSIVTVAERVADSVGSIDFAAMAASLTRLTDTVDSAVGDADIPALAKRLGDLAETADRFVVEIGKAVGSGDRPGLVADIRAAVRDLGGLSAELTALTRSLRDDVRFADLGDTLESLNRASAQLETLLSSLRERPSRLIFDDAD